MRIVSLSPSVTEILFALGLDDEIVGVTRFCDFPEKAKTKPVMGGWVDVDFDLVKKQNPDIVFTSTIVQEKIFQQGRRSKLNMVHLSARNLDDVLYSFIQIGSAVNRSRKAHALVTSFRDELSKIKAKAKRIYVEEWPMMVSANWVPDILKSVGAISLAKSGVPSYEITTAQIHAFDPNIIIISWCGCGARVPKEKITKRDGWENISAIKENKVFVVDDSLFNRPGPRLIAGAELLAKLMNN